MVPVSATCDVDAWVLNPKLNYYNKSDVDYKRAVDCIAREYSHYSLEEIVDVVKVAKSPSWLARHPKHYLSLDESVKIILKLLVCQYGSDEFIGAFLCRVNNICEKKIPKLNSMFIHSPPNSGKSFFIDMVSSFYLNVGHVANFVRGEAFPLNDCVNKRVLVWNEPSIAPSMFDDVKMLAGGDPLPAKVKYQSNAVITRTPLFFTSNVNMFDKQDPVWTSRIYFEEWQPCIALKKIKQYPHPMAYYELLKKYNVISMNQ